MNVMSETAFLFVGLCSSFEFLEIFMDSQKWEEDC